MRREMQQVAVLGHKEEDEPVNQAKQLAVEVLLVQLAGL